MNRSIGEITTNGRHRKRLGDIEGLARSIEDVGLLNPVTITDDGRLVAGYRRLEACKLLGWGEVPVQVAASVDGAVSLLIAERDENTCREPMRPSELVALGMEVEALEKPKAAARRRAHGGTAPGRPANTCDPGSTSVPRVREKVGKALGISGATYQRGRAITDAAHDPERPPEIRDAARKALDEMDETGRVRSAYEKFIRATTKGSAPEPPKTKRERILAESHLRRAEKFVATLAGHADGLETLDVDRIRSLSVPDAERIADDLARSLTRVRKFRNALTTGGPQ